MELNQILEKLDKKQKGSWFRLDYCKDLPITAQAKKNGFVVLKYSRSTVRYGIDYKNLKSTKEKIEQGKILTNKLNWGSWIPGYEGKFIEHKGKYYLRIYSSPNKTKSSYFLNGRPIKIEKLKEMNIVQKSYWNSGKEPTDTLTICVNNIQEIY